MKDKVVVITGAARGIGAALTRGFLARGARIVAMDRNWDEADELPQALRKADHLVLGGDITAQQDVDRAYADALARFHTVDVLINNAAMRQRDFYPASGASTVLDTTDEQWERMYRVNVVGSLKMIRAFIRPMRAQKQGCIINVSANGSLTFAAEKGGAEKGIVDKGVYVGNHPHLLNQPYDATKSALTNMAFYLAAEVKAENISVNSIFPGGTRTTGTMDMVAERKRLGFVSQLQEPEHVFPVCLYLAGQRGAEITGRAFDLMEWYAANPAIVEAAKA